MSKKEAILQKLKSKYKLTIYNEETLREALTFKLSRLNVFTYIGITFILITLMVIMLFAFTPLNMFLPKYTDSTMSRNIITNALLIDSLEQELVERDQFLQNLQNLMQGKKLNNYESVQDTTMRYTNIDFARSKHDSILRQKIETEEQENLSVVKNDGNSSNSNKGLNSLHFFVPVKGILVNKFNVKEAHYGIDLVASPNEAVMATLSGTVIIATWSLSTGYIIQVQHENNLISIYKHNSTLLRKVGDHVSAGESIAIIGNSGELTSGPHLHFELWHNGIPLNPEDYITF